MPRKLNPDQRNNAKVLYVSGEAARAISERLGINYHTVKRWAERGGWASLRKQSAQIINQELIYTLAERSRKALDLLKPSLDMLCPKVPGIIRGQEERIGFRPFTLDDNASSNESIW